MTTHRLDDLGFDFGLDLVLLLVDVSRLWVEEDMRDVDYVLGMPGQLAVDDVDDGAEEARSNRFLCPQPLNIHSLYVRNTIF